jgi:hypothetical protein
MRAASIFFSLVFAASAGAQVLTVGNDVTPTGSDVALATIRTAIDLVSPATATGTISAIKYAWSPRVCPAAFKIKFFHRSGNLLKMTEERGPFDSTESGSLTLSSPVAVSQGDLIGITRVSDCGNTGALYAGPSEGFLVYAADVTGVVDVAAGFRTTAGRLAVFGSGSATESVRGVITSVGATRGSFGSNFKTSLQLFNPFDYTLTGRIDFRPAGAGSTVANAVLYSLGPGQVTAWPDIVGTTLGQSGLGSLDLVVTAGQSAPLGIARVYNDAGPDGTSAFTEEIIDPDVMLKGVTNILERGMTGYLVTPINPSLTRFNIGLRTLERGATVNASLKDSAGSTITSITRSYPPQWFEQNSAAAFFGVPISGNQTVVLEVTAGSVIIYGTTTDNTTNDPNVQFAKIIFSTGG